MNHPNQTKNASCRFDSLPLSQELLQVIAELGFEALTPIQAQSIPVLLEGRDLIGQSKTGSGKTAAFSLPILQKLGDTPRFQTERRLQALILCPTRELCTQVAREIRKLGRRQAGLQVLVLSGGQPMFPQLTALEKGVHIVVGTPGRVLDHLSRNTLDLSQVSTVVLDEADRMLDMGFEEDMEKILVKLPETRQLVLFSATFPRSIESMSGAYQHQPVRVTIAEAPETAPDIRQTLYEIENEDKFDTLLALFEENRPESAIVFCNLKATVAELTNALIESGISAAAIHGDLEQRDRDRVMAKFRNQSIRILIATDVAARGIDIEKLDMVICFDVPSDPEVYVHRIGRTGRAGQKGWAVSFAAPRESRKVDTIEDFTGKRLERARLALSAHPSGEASPPTKAFLQDAKMETLYIAAGRKEKMRPGDILGALTGEAGGLSGTDIGKIEIHDHFSYVAVTKNIARTAVERLSNGRIKGRKFRVGLAH